MTDLPARLRAVVEKWRTQADDKLSAARAHWRYSEPARDVFKRCADALLGALRAENELVLLKAGTGHLHIERIEKVSPPTGRLSPRDRARQALTLLIHETGSASICLSGITLTDVAVDLETRVADAIADAEAAIQSAGAVGRAEPPDDLSFETFREVNQRRCETAFHQVTEWKPWEWSNAMAGEAGEACNLTKKMNRIWPASQFKQSWNRPEDQRMADLEARLASELGDVVIYADLLATCIGRRLEDCVRDSFNAKSDEIGSAVKLPAPPVTERRAP